MTAPLGGIYWRARIITPEGTSVAVSTYGWAASASGSRTHSGSASGTYGWAGFAGEIVKRGSASGAYGWVGSAVGETPAPVLPAFDAAAGVAAALDNYTFDHTAEEGSYALVYVAYRTGGAGRVAGITYDGQPMALLAANGWCVCYGLDDVPGGTKTVAVTMSGFGNQSTAASLSWADAKSVSGIEFQPEAGNQIRHDDAPCGDGEIVVQAFAAQSTDFYFPNVTDWAVTGGVARASVNSTNLSVGVNDSDTDLTDFIATTATWYCKTLGISLNLSNRESNQLGLYLLGRPGGAVGSDWTTEVTVPPGGYVLLPIYIHHTGTLGAVTIDGQPMTLLASQKSNNQNQAGTLQVYGYADAVGGNRTISVGNGFANTAARPMVYSDVTNAAAVTSYGSGVTATATSTANSGADDSASLPVELPHTLTGLPSTARTVVQLFGSDNEAQTDPSRFTSPTGGRNRFNMGRNWSSLCVSDAVCTTTDETFQATLSPANEWAGITVELT